MLIIQKTLWLFWTIGSLCNLLTLFGLYGRHLSIEATATYVALSRITWAIGISWILIACHTNNAGFLNKLLSLKVWVPLSRLSFCAYLLNPLLINSVYLQSESAVHVDFLPTVSENHIQKFLQDILNKTDCFIVSENNVSRNRIDDLSVRVFSNDFT